MRAEGTLALWNNIICRIFYGKLTFKEHVKWTAAKADRIIASISQLMLNLGQGEGVLNEGRGGWGHNQLTGHSAHTGASFRDVFKKDTRGGIFCDFSLSKKNFLFIGKYSNQL